MQDHRSIDQRSLELARAIAKKIDRDPKRQGVYKALAVCRRWSALPGIPQTSLAEWFSILETADWAAIKAILLDPSEEGKRMRQNSPFCGILTPRERWAIYRKSRTYDTTTA